MLELVEGGYIIGSSEFGFQTDNLTTSFIAQNVPTSRSALNINSMSTTSNIPTSSSALNINSINLNADVCVSEFEVGSIYCSLVSVRIIVGCE
jgi:hypothetical protein